MACMHSAQSWSFDRKTGQRHCSDCEAMGYILRLLSLEGEHLYYPNDGRGNATTVREEARVFPTRRHALMALVSLNDSWAAIGEVLPNAATIYGEYRCAAPGCGGHPLPRCVD